MMPAGVDQARDSQSAAMSTDGQPQVDALLMELKSRHPKVWMTVTNTQGRLLPKSLLKFCKQRGLPDVDVGDLAALVSALLQSLDNPSSSPTPSPAGEAQERPCGFTEAELLGIFRELCCQVGAARRDAAVQEEGQRLRMGEWLAWEWLKSRIGPPGSLALLTLAAAEEIWATVVSSKGYDSARACEFLELAREVDVRCGHATSIQALLRGRASRRHADTLKVTGCGEQSCGPKLAPFNPTPDSAVAQALDALDVGPPDLVYDLGCGDGRFLLAAALRGARAFGIDYDATFVERARASASKAGVADLVEVVHGDASSTDLGPATKIFVYLVPDGLRLVAPALIAALEGGVPIATYTFSLPGLEPTQVLEAASGCKIWVYRDAHPTAAAGDAGDSDGHIPADGGCIRSCQRVGSG